VRILTTRIEKKIGNILEKSVWIWKRKGNRNTTHSFHSRGLGAAATVIS